MAPSESAPALSSSPILPSSSPPSSTFLIGTPTPLPSCSFSLSVPLPSRFLSKYLLNLSPPSPPARAPALASSPLGGIAQNGMTGTSSCRRGQTHHMPLLPCTDIDSGFLDFQFHHFHYLLFCPAKRKKNYFYKKIRFFSCCWPKYLAGPPEERPAAVAGRCPVVDAAVLEDGISADAAAGFLAT